MRSCTEIRTSAGRGAVETTFQYDALGRKTSQMDRDTGTTSFAYNALGELVQQTDALNHKVERWLDARGRLWRQRAYKGASLESTAQFEFDTLKRGLPTSDFISGSTGSQSRSYGYDTLARPIRRDSTMDGRTYREQTQYDSYGRAWKTRDASGQWLKQQFDARGFATRLCDSTEADAVLQHVGLRPGQLALQCRIKTRPVLSCATVHRMCNTLGNNMSEATFTFRVDETLKSEFATAAKARDRTGAQLLRDFMRDFVQQQREAAEYDVWFRSKVQAGLDSADAGRLVSAAEVEARFAARRAATRHRLEAPE